MTQLHHRHHNPRYRKKYKVSKWPSYELSLIKRGDYPLWLSESAIQAWYGDSNDLVGRPQVYSELAIENHALDTSTPIPIEKLNSYLCINALIK